MAGIYVGIWRYVGKPYFSSEEPSRLTLEARRGSVASWAKAIGEQSREEGNETCSSAEAKKELLKLRVSGLVKLRV
jgi:hypothetical protein